MSDYTLTSELLKLSKSRIWDRAKLEWDVVDIHKVEEPETCLCGHYPIVEICTIENTQTNQQARVGNCCVKKFNDKSNKIFRAVERVKKASEKSLNSETLDLGKQNKWISEKDFDFYTDILRKRTLSPKQLAWKESINRKIVSRVSKTSGK